MTSNVRERARRSATPPPSWDKAIVLRRPLNARWYLLLFLLLVAVYATYPILLISGQTDLGYIAVYSSEGTIETVGATACLLAAFVFFSAYQAARRSTEHVPAVGRPAWPPYYLIAAIVMLAMFGEEIGWGSRLAAWFSPSSAPQREWSIGDLMQPKNTTYRVAMTYWIGIVLFYTFALPIAARFSVSTGVWSAQRRIPMPSRTMTWITGLFSMASLVLVFKPGMLLMGPSELEVAFETGIELLLLGWAIEEYRWSRVALQRKASRLLNVLCTLSILIAASIASQEIVTRGIPAAESQQLYRLGMSYAEQGEPQSAIETLKKSVESFPFNDAALYALAHTLHQQGRVAEAIPYYNAAVEVAPTNWQYHEGAALGYINMYTGPSFREALKHLRAACELIDEKDPHRTDLLILYEKVDAFRKAGEYAIGVPGVKEQVEEWKKKQREKIKEVDPAGL